MINNRKKFESKVDENEVLEFEGFTISQEIYCHRYPDKQLSRGTIEKIHLNESIGPYFTFNCDVSGQFRKSMFADIIAIPTDKMRLQIEKNIAKDRLKLTAKLASKK